jgi:hypothetical protein
MDTAECTAKVSDLVQSKAVEDRPQVLMLKHDVSYAHRAGMLHIIALIESLHILKSTPEELVARMRACLGQQVEVQYSPLPSTSTPQAPLDSTDGGVAQHNPSMSSACARSNPTRRMVLYVGTEGLSLTNIVMIHSDCEVQPRAPCLSSILRTISGIFI